MIEMLLAQLDPLGAALVVIVWREVRHIKKTVCTDVKPRIERLETEWMTTNA